MTSVQQRQLYYKQMIDLQEKCRKSEEERIKLEEKYNKLKQETQIRHEACINRLRLRYIRFLEEQRARDERNNKLLGALDQVDSNLALITTKTERLNALKKHYESCISRAIEDDNERNASCTFGDSGVASQIDPKTVQQKRQLARHESVVKFSPLLTSTSSLCSRFDDHYGSINSVRFNPSSIQSSSPRTSPRRLQSNSQFSLPLSSRVPNLYSSKVRIPSMFSTNGDNNYLPQTFAKTSSQFHDFRISSPNVPRLYTDSRYSRNDLPISRRADYLPYSFQRRNIQSAETSPRDFKVSDLDTLIEKSAKLLCPEDYPKFTPTYNYTSSLSNVVDPNLEPANSQYKTIETLEKKLDQYIKQIRKLHGEPEPAEATVDDEYEYNTSGDLLNETLSDDGIPTCDTHDKTDLAPDGSKIEQNENKSTKPDEDKSDQANDADEGGAAGGADKFTTSTNVPVSDTSPESVAPVIDQNNTKVVADEPTEDIEKIDNEVQDPNQASTSKAMLEEEMEKLDSLQDKDNGERDERQTESQEAEKEEEVEEVEEVENTVEDKQAIEEVSYEYREQYEGQEYDPAQGQEYPSDQNYDQNYDQSSADNYYQEYQVDDQNQGNEQPYSEQYDQNYDQYQYEQDPNQQYDTGDQYSNSQQYTEEGMNQQYEYNYDDPNLNQQYEVNEKYDNANYVVNNEQVYSDQEAKVEYQTGDTGDVNEHEYERDDYVEQEPQHHANTEPTAEGKEEDTENITKRRENSDSESTIERNTVSNVESDFDFN